MRDKITFTQNNPGGQTGFDRFEEIITTLNPDLQAILKRIPEEKIAQMLKTFGEAGITPDKINFTSALPNFSSKDNNVIFTGTKADGEEVKYGIDVA
ncbi:MAG: hypothetical protein PHT51_02890 [Patescibacteria group bacterium]|nr:hypothetical protein [Patescibacteria group bacterium]MDD4610802.1 hypothetical protein [Patescibacteria group bacterium]